MSRQEALNTFTDGLVMDLNPLTTPDNVLTDCLNGTLITYNNNEFILQNDQGNYKLENCKLKPNFIPVGIKEHANILYIVSYNPITNETEIGSYPSPQRIFKSEFGQSSSLSPIINTAVANTYLYSELIPKFKTVVHFNAKDGMEKWLISPGDEIRLKCEDVIDEKFPYQVLSFSVLSEDKNLYPIENISDFINKGWKYVSWETPGWLATSYKIATIDAFTLNITDVEIPEFSLSESFSIKKFEINVQMELSDEIFKRQESELDKVFGVQLKVGNNTVTNWDLKKLTHNNLYYLHTTVDLVKEGFLTSKFKSSDNIVITATPILKKNGITIVYDQFTTSYTLNLNDVITDVNKIQIATSKFQHITSQNSVAVTFNIAGPFLAQSKLKFYYNLYRLDGTSVYSEDVLYNDINLFGQNTIIFKTPEIQLEDIYLMTFYFKEDSQIIKRQNKILITSQLFNDFRNEYSDFNQIAGDLWLSKFKDTIEWISPLTWNVTGENAATPEWTKIQDFPETYWQSNTTMSLPEVQWRLNQKLSVKGNLNGKFTHLTGPMWRHENDSTKDLDVTFDIFGKFGTEEIKLSDKKLNEEIAFEGLFYDDYKVYLNRQETNYTLKEGKKIFFKEMWPTPGTNSEILAGKPNVLSKIGYKLKTSDNHGYYSLYASLGKFPTKESMKDLSGKVFIPGAESDCLHMVGDQIENVNYVQNSIRENRIAIDTNLEHDEWGGALNILAKEMFNANLPILLCCVTGTDGERLWEKYTDFRHCRYVEYNPKSKEAGKNSFYFFIMRTESKQFYINNSLTQSKTADFPFIILLPQQLSSAVATSKTLSFSDVFENMYSILENIGENVYLMSKVIKEKKNFFGFNANYINTSQDLIEIKNLTSRSKFSNPYYNGNIDYGLFQEQGRLNIYTKLQQLSNTLSNSIQLNPNLFTATDVNLALSSDNFNIITNQTVFYQEKNDTFTKIQQEWESRYTEENTKNKNEYTIKLNETMDVEVEEGQCGTTKPSEEWNYFVDLLTVDDINPGEEGYQLKHVKVRAQSEKPAKVYLYRRPSGSSSDQSVIGMADFVNVYTPNAN